MGYGQSGSRGRSGRSANGNTGRTFTVPTNQQWTDTGINVQRGQTIKFRASGNVTLGHRFLSSGVVTIPRALDYAQVLSQQGGVIASFDAR